jgi:hypothetical protein
MKLQNIFRTHVVVIGFAAAFLLASGARTQEIENTVWAESSTVESFPQPVHVAVTNDVKTVATNSVDADAAAVIAEPSMIKVSVVSEWATREGWLIAMSILLMAPLALLLLAKVRRVKHNVNVRAYQSKRSAALA